MNRSTHIRNERSAPRTTDGQDIHTPQSTSSSVTQHAAAAVRPHWGDLAAGRSMLAPT
jgi:hypothetical protein